MNIAKLNTSRIKSCFSHKYLIFMDIGYPLSSLGEYAEKYIESIVEKWHTLKERNLVALILVGAFDTIYFSNPISGIDYLKYFGNKDLHHLPF